MSNWIKPVIFGDVILMKTTDIYYLKTYDSDHTSMYVHDKGQCDDINSAKQFTSMDDALVFAQLKKIKPNKITIHHVITQEEYIHIDSDKIIVSQNKHTDATHIGTINNPYFYYMSNDGTLYYYNVFLNTWELDENQTRTDIAKVKHESL